VFDRLFPVPKASVTVIGNTGAVAAAPTRAYTDASVPPCEVCGGKRVFECQLMPNLINVTAAGSARTNEKQTDAERRAALQASLEKRGGGRGMEWGTCMIFSCAKDCGKGESWLEEAVLVQWED
jgi:pre-rRNA-processing protein TSR4